MKPDVVIVGGAAMGSSVAAHLLAAPQFGGRVVVVEKDTSYRLAASALSAASLRQQYSQAVNIQLSLHGLAFLRDPGKFLPIEQNQKIFGLKEAGYLYLAESDASATVLKRNNALQVQEGADIALLARDALSKRFPWLEVDDVKLGSLGITGEGWFDGWALLQVLRNTARHLEATYIPDEVIGIRTESDRVVEITLKERGRLACDILVNCAGSGGPRLAELAGIDIPVQAKRRSVFAFSCKTTLPGCPLLIDTSGVWMRPDSAGGENGQDFIAGWSPPAESDPDWRDDDPNSREVDWDLFEAIIWPALATRIPALQEIRPGRAWSGPYDMNLLDHNAIVGRVPSLANFYLCNGFSGHGLQHSPAIGRAVSELIIHGDYRTIDISDLGYRRIVENNPLVETNVI